MKHFKILMYSHDSLGLGHTSRTVAIASHIASRLPDSQILIATGLSIFGKYKLPNNVDYVRFPGIRKLDNKSYESEKLLLKFNQIKRMRSHIIHSTAKTFKPDMFIVDKTPLGIKGELASTLKYLRKHRPNTKTVLGIRDILDSPKIVKEEWETSGVFHLIKKYFDEIWIYGDPGVYDFIKEYNVPPVLHNKIYYTGYLKKPVDFRRGLLSSAQKPISMSGTKMVLVTVGGGEDGYPVLDKYLRFLETANGQFSNVVHNIYTGPFMPLHLKKNVKSRAKNLPNVSIRTFSSHFLRMISQADLVVSMGGYNTTAEILCYKKKAIIIPRVYPRQEQLIRAKIFEEKGIVKMLPPEKVSPEMFGEYVQELLFQKNGKDDSLFSKIATNGLDTVLDRVVSLAGI